MLFTPCYNVRGPYLISKWTRIQSFSSAVRSAPTQLEDEEFRVLQILPKPKQFGPQRTTKFSEIPPRTDKMSVDQDWPSVWPGPRSFHPASVPLPLRQGYKHNLHPHPNKWANAELMKIPNFLHLTPPAVRRHCEALKQFCTKWPEGLETEEQCTKHFPMEIITSDYCHSSSSIRNPLARIVSLKVKLSSLSLDIHAKDKLLRLIKDRYNSETDYITITADRCPVKNQNLQYVLYLLTALYHESWRIEPWEADKKLADMEIYDWDKHQSRINLVNMHEWPETPTNFTYDDIPHASEYKTVVTNLINEGENEHSINQYKEVVKNLLHLKPKSEK